MPAYQLPPLKNEKQFEEFVCDLFNEVERATDYTNTDFQEFGVKGQQQKGVDIYSARTQTAIQCKLKDIRKSDAVIRKALQDDIAADLMGALTFDAPLCRFIFVSTFRDDAKLQEYMAGLQQKLNKSITLYYWGWDTLSKYAQEHEIIIKKYYPQFVPKPKRQPKPIIELPEGALGKDLLKKNYTTYLIKKYGDWKQFELDRTNQKFNWASFNKHIMNRYKAASINYIHVSHFDDMQNYLKDRIDKTIFGRKRRSDGNRNYSSFEEHTSGIVD